MSSAQQLLSNLGQDLSAQSFRGGGISKRSEVRIIKQTHLIDKPSLTAQRSAILSVKNQAGFLRSLGFKSGAVDYVISVVIDGTYTFKHSFTEVVDLSELNADFQAYIDTNGNYILVIGNLSFKNTIDVSIIPPDSSTNVQFSNVFGVWDEL